MTATAFATLFTNLRRLSQAKQILLAALFCLGLAVPSASANCLGKGLLQPQITPAAPRFHAESEAAEPQAVYANAPVSIVGLWNLKFYSEGQVVDVAFDAWHGDGTEILNDYTDPVEGNVCLGVWRQTGPLTYTLKHPSWLFDDRGVLQGTVVINEIVTLSKDGNSFSGSYTDDVYDVSGNLLEKFTGKLKATRIKPN